MANALGILTPKLLPHLVIRVLIASNHELQLLSGGVPENVYTMNIPPRRHRHQTQDPGAPTTLALACQESLGLV